MFIVLRFFNNVILMLINYLIAIYVGRRFFVAMTLHYKLVAEIMEFNLMVKEARDSLDYTTSKISEVMKEMETDIGQEIYMTHNLTKLSSKMSMLLSRYAEVEDRVLEFIRMNENTESVQIETPSDIKSEVEKILTKARKNELIISKKPLTPNSENILTE